LSVELDTIESDKDKDAEADVNSKALPLAEAHGKDSVSASDKIQILDVEASESNHSILDTIRAQRRRTRKLAITITAVVFCLLLLTGAIYGAVVDATWKKYQSKVSLSAAVPSVLSHGSGLQLGGSVVLRVCILPRGSRTKGCRRRLEEDYCE
jgi:hypothetical protein